VRSAREPRLEAVLYSASGSASGPASGPSPRSGTPISRALHAQTSREHVSPWVVNNHIEFMYLRESSDSADPFISATAIQLTPSYTTICYVIPVLWTTSCLHVVAYTQTDSSEDCTDLTQQNVYPAANHVHVSGEVYAHLFIPRNFADFCRRRHSETFPL